MMQSNDGEVGLAIVGAGLVAQLHSRAIQTCHQARLVGVYDVQPERAQQLAAEHKARVYQSQDELLKDGDVCGVHVLTPPTGHVPATIAALEAGKHVLLEKPLADQAEDLYQIASTAAQQNRLCMPAHNYIYVPSLLQAKRLIDEGKLGKIAAFWMLFNLYHTRELVEKYGSIYRVACTHHAYSLLYLLGRPSRLISFGVPGVHTPDLPYAAQTAITCEMPNGALANLWASFAANDLTNDPWQVVYKVLGTQGGVNYSWNEACYEDDGGPGFGMPGYVDSFCHEVDFFVNRCILANQQPLSTLQDALDALRIIEASEVASRKGTAIELQFDDLS
ncbi:MAG: Gfo/Idh/MocA family oxidoreductase [Pirellulaceae bacterium]|nr:Gfo/Idh/MocA family oxidoreductase [Pirellulaceae bacterium]